MAKSNQPAAKFRIGFVTATVWQNDKFYNCELSRSYKDREEDEWRETTSLGHGDMLNAIKVLERAEAWIAAQ